MHHSCVRNGLNLIAGLAQAPRIFQTLVLQRIEFRDDDERRRQSREVVANERSVAKVTPVFLARAIVAVEPLNDPTRK